MPPCRNNSLPNETASDEGERQGTVLFFQSGAAGNQSLKHVDIAVACIIQLQGSCFSWLKGGRIVTADNT